MSESQEKLKGPASLLEAWMKSATAFWGSMARMKPSPTGTPEAPSPPKAGEKTRMQESWETAFKTWQSLSLAMSEPGVVETMYKGINILPEVLLKMAQTGWNGYFNLQRKGMERVGRLGQRPEAYKFEELDREAFKVWAEIYEKEFRQFLNVPQLGLMRFYQEKMGRTLDKFNLFQASMAEFMHLLYLPMEKSFRVMQEKIEELTKQGKLPENPQEYYRIWLKILEGHYMILFKSSEYTEVMGKTLSAMEDFIGARNEAFEDILQMLPVATNKDMDELYKELYALKKKLKQLEKKTQLVD